MDSILPHRSRDAVHPVARYGTAVLTVVAAGLIHLLLWPFLQGFSPFLLFHLAVLLSAVRGGIGPGILATLLSAVFVELILLSPRGLIALTPLSHLFGLLLFCAVGFSITWLAHRLRAAERRSARSEAEARTESGRITLIADSLPVAIAYIDPAQRLTFCNQAGRDFFKLDGSEVLGRRLPDLLDPEVYPRLEPHLRRAMGGDRVTFDFALPDPDSAPAEIRGTLIPDCRQRAVCGAVILFEDITESKRVERSLQFAYNRLREANQELESFAYSVTHDLRAPLRTMEGFSQALLEDYGAQLDETGRDYATRIIAAAKRLDMLIRDLLFYSRLGRTEVESQKVPLAEVVDEVRRLYKDSIQERQAQVRVRRPLPTVYAHSGMLVQALGNLLSNAIKFVPQGIRPEVEIWAERRDDFVKIWVRDNGIGIDPAYHAEIFEPFRRIHGSAYPGTGIGLAIVRKSAVRMGGSSGILSEPGKGSSFWIELPGGEQP